MMGRERVVLRTGMLLALTVGLAAGGPREVGAQQAPPSCEELEVHRQWDFWVGSWDVVVNLSLIHI